jgi:hypothetical protein
MPILILKKELSLIRGEIPAIKYYGERKYAKPVCASPGRHKGD